MYDCCYLFGTVVEYNKATCLHKIAYDDGTDQWLDLRKGTKFIWLKDDNGSENKTSKATDNKIILGSLADLVQKNYLPSDALLETKYDGKTYQARLDCTSSALVLIHDRLRYFDSLSGWAVSCFRSSNPTKKTANGWHEVRYNGKSLEDIRSDYLSQIQRDQNQNIRSEVEKTCASESDKVDELQMKRN